jgi:hypothetical protein
VEGNNSVAMVRLHHFSIKCALIGVRSQNARLHKGFIIKQQEARTGSAGRTIIFQTFEDGTTPTLRRMRVKNQTIADGFVKAVEEQVAKL